MAKPSTVSKLPLRRVEEVELDRLHLDTMNPRFGRKNDSLTNEVEVLDSIVGNFGVDDLLSSLAVNGYFEGEPLVGLRGKGNNIRILEGNRRLAACLILANAPRAINQQKRVVTYQKIQKEHHREPITKIPVSVFEESEYKAELLPYLGVRHIAASQPWDSYAKARWIADVLEKGNLSLADIAQMIGDQHRTTAKLVEGYYFVTQLINEARFKPDNSTRRGRGSNPEYPFSWVYTALSLSPVRRWLELKDITEAVSEEPVPTKRLADAEELMILLFGNKEKKRSAAINDSREITELAKAIADPKLRAILKRVGSIYEVTEQAKPTYERVTNGLSTAQESLENVLILITGNELTYDHAKELLDPCSKVVSFARDVQLKLLKTLATSNEDKNENAKG